jgi:membrane-associated phospholipid phosphatase
MEQARSLPLRARVDRLRLAGLVLAATLVGLSALLVGGVLDPVDRYAVSHLMPGLEPAEADETVPPVTGLFMPFGLGTPSWQKALELWTYPASVLVSLLVFGFACWTLVRRGRRVAALVWAGTWVAANAVEVMLKVGLTKPALTVVEGGAVHHVRPFDHSFPSGHTLRAVLVAGIVAYVWPRLAVPAAIWALLVPALLVAASAHVPSDVIGGLVLGLLAVVVTLVALPIVETRLRPQAPG